MPAVWCRIRSGVAHLFYTTDKEALSAVATAQEIIWATPAVLGRGWVRGHPSLQYSSLLRSQGPAATDGLHLPSSSNAPLCPRPKGGQPATSATPKRGSSPGTPPSAVQHSTAPTLLPHRALRSVLSRPLLRPRARRSPGKLLNHCANQAAEGRSKLCCSPSGQAPPEGVDGSARSP
ncbi:hypothetical protein NDU88_004919 [Pleurodeles waltl]|uniref:Uncharacterized protein n=1 Tax=Pleurodeles waltl TaxID=8319 RepID=A0AAV7TTZ3_PLEWA|nr:hypothetical protein NDU88_004919 [Pleurodeles waltl]